MRQRLFNLAAAVSLALCVATVALWVRSYWRCDYVLVAIGPASPNPALVRPAAWEVMSCAGRLTVGRGTDYRPLRPRLQHIVSRGRLYTAGVGRDLLTAPYSLLYWPVTLVAAVLPSVWFRRRVRQRQHARRGLCPQCGYDLRATPVKCPECGLDVRHGELPAA